jgi:pyruvate-ferredoxin/flavodoxin oxidoreductase
METRYKMLTLSKPEQAKRLLELAQGDVLARYRLYKQLASLSFTDEEAKPADVKAQVKSS